MSDTPQDKILSGVPAIAAVMDRSPRRLYTILERGELPAWKCGGTWTTTERTLIEHVAAKAKAAE